MRWKKELLNYIVSPQKPIYPLEGNGKIGMTFLDNFEFPDLSKYHPLKRHVRYYKELLPSQSEG